MAECRYFPECQRCNEVGDSWIPCTGGSDGIRCDNYEPIPDMDALLELADYMERQSKICEEDYVKTGEPEFAGEYSAYRDCSRRIREALGEDS